MALSIFKILSEALRLSAKNPKLVLHLQLLYFLSAAVLFSLTLLFLTPLASDIAAKSVALGSLESASPEYASLSASILKDLGEVLGIQIVLILASFVLDFLVSIATIRIFSLSYTRELLNFKNLLLRVFKNLKGPLITRLCVVLLSYAFTLPFVIAIVALVLFFKDSSTVLVAALLVLLVVFVYLYLYLSMVWSVGVVVSVVEEEEGCYGLAAISRASETVGGRRMQGRALNLIVFLMSGVVFGIYSFGNGYMISKDQDASVVVKQLGWWLFFLAVSVFRSLYRWVVFVVFYCDYKEDG